MNAPFLTAATLKITFLTPSHVDVEALIPRRLAAMADEILHDDDGVNTTHTIVINDSRMSEPGQGDLLAEDYEALAYRIPGATDIETEMTY